MLLTIQVFEYLLAKRDVLRQKQKVQARIADFERKKSVKSLAFQGILNRVSNE